MKVPRFFALLIVCILGLVACSPALPQPPASPVVSVQPATQSPVTVQPTGSSTTAAQPAADAWEDRTIFGGGLIQAEQETLQQLPGASIYHLDVSIADNFTSLQGQEQVRYTNQETQSLDAIYFQLFPNMAGGTSSVSAVKVDGQEVQPVYEADHSTVQVPLPAPLQPGQHTVVQMDFQVEVPNRGDGNYGLFAYIDDILVLDGFYPAIPVYDEQGWHAGKLPPNADTTFQDASFYVVRVTAPAALTLIAAGSEVERVEKDASQVVTFAAGPVRDFYLAASDRFEVVSDTLGETRINSYAYQNRTEGARAALRTAVEALKSFNLRFGTYPYTELDIVSTPMQGALGVEYPGIAGINYALYDLNATVSGAPAPIVLESTVAHEMGHQWFYNVVGNDQSNAPWLDEALVQYVTGLYFLDRYGQSGMDGYRQTWESRWARVERKAIPVGLPAGSYQGKEYGAIVYGRGPLFMEALAKKMGLAQFDPFLKKYYQAYKWGVATATGFRQMAGETCQCDLTPLFAEWVDAPAANGAAASGVKIYYEDNAQVEVIAPGGQRVLIDVWHPSSLSAPAVAGDVLLTTHTHDDHLYRNFYQKFPGQQLFVKEGKIDLPQVKIQGIAAAHSAGNAFRPEGGSDYIFMIDVGGLRIAHFGDIGQETLTDEQMKALGQVDIAITQFDNSYSQMSVANKKGFNLMEQLKPRLIIQTHTSLEAVEYAKTLWPMLYSEKPFVTLTAAQLPQQTSLLLLGDRAAFYASSTGAVKVDW